MGVVYAVLFASIAALSGQSERFSPADLVRNMERAYEEVQDYRMEVEVRKAGEDGHWRVEKFTYYFKKPRHVRIDFAKPHRGTIVVYPGRDGKVLVRPWGRRSLDFHLRKESVFLADRSGQRIDQTDLGILIQNISESIGDRRRGSVEIAKEAHAVAVRVPAEDHFIQGKVTLYEFVIDRKSWLPVKIKEFTPAGAAKREIFFRNIQINPGMGDDFFRLNGN